MRSGDITRVTGVPELTWCYNRNKMLHFDVSSITRQSSGLTNPVTDY